jgi:hypothetical protein
VAAAGNSGSIVDAAVHQSVHVSNGTTMRVPITTGGATDGGVQVWVAMHAGGGMRVGLDGPDGTWISPVGEGDSAGKNTNDYNAAIYNGKTSDTPVPQQSHGAVVVWQRKWPTGTYNITLSGSGTAELYLQATGDASIPGVREVNFVHGVRESTINLPATTPSIIGVGCTINKPSWRNMHMARLGLVVPVLDESGGMVDPGGATRDAVGGEPCWFTSAGPTLTGLQKPEIMAPGAAIVGAMSQQAIPPAASSIFTNPGCPDKSGTGTDVACQQVDATHAVSFGTSFAAPIVSGTVAVLLQHDPTLTQDAIVAALQGGSHPLRGAAPYQDQLGAGEVDVLGAIAAVDALRNPQTALPDRSSSWLTLGADTYLADGSTPLEAVVELRAAHAAGTEGAPADGFAQARLAPYALVDGALYAGAVRSFARLGPGVWVATVRLPAGLGGSTLTVGATFDGSDIVQARSIPIATDVWNAEYPPSVQGGCAMGRDKPGWGWILMMLAAGAGVARARRARTSAMAQRAENERSDPAPPHEGILQTRGTLTGRWLGWTVCSRSWRSSRRTSCGWEQTASPRCSPPARKGGWRSRRPRSRRCASCSAKS